MWTLLRPKLLSLLIISGLNLSETAECQPLKIDLRKFTERETVKLTQIGATDIQYIPLQTTEQNVLPEIKEIVFSKSFFLTHNYANINMFRYDGSFVTKIGNEGRGPNEFTVAHDLDINPKNESIYLVDGWLKKFLVYNKNGKLTRTFKSPLVGAVYFRMAKDGILCYNQNNMANIENSYILIDTTGKVIMNYPNTYKWQHKTNPSYGFLHENLFYRFNNQIFKKEMYSDTVFVYRNKAFEPHLLIDVGKLRITPEARTNSPVEYIIHNFLVPKSLFECGNYIYYEFNFQANDKNEGFSFIVSKVDNFRVLFDPEKGLVNDFDGGLNILPQTAKDINTMVAWIDALQLKTYVASETFKRNNPKFPEKKKELKILADKLKETDNPVVILIKIK
jgi:hypothetical protein